MEKVNKGDDVSLSASDVNGWQDAADFVKRQYRSGGGNDAGKYLNQDIIRVKNDSGVALDTYAAVVISAPVVTPAENEEDFKRAQFWKVKKPTDVGQPFVILLQPLGANEFGMAIVSGSAYCKINLTSVSDLVVDSEAAKTIPKSGTSGAAQILWVAGGVGTASATGEQWAFIRIGGAGAALPYGEFQGMGIVTLTDHQIGFDFPRLYPPLD